MAPTTHLLARCSILYIRNGMELILKRIMIDRGQHSLGEMASDLIAVSGI
jgi:hypothetical protein